MRTFCCMFISTILLIFFLLFSSGYAADKAHYSTEPPVQLAKKWRIAYYEGGAYAVYPKTLMAIVKELAALGWTEPLMVTIPLPRKARNVIRYFKTSLNSELATIQALSQASDESGMNHEIILMVDNGDLREGVMPEDTLETVRKILEIKSRHLKFCGLGSNLGCCSGTLPDEENMNLLQELATDIEKYLGHPVETISVGGSVVLDWLEYHDLPSRINQIRLGEVILLGNNPSVNKKQRDFFDDVFTLKGEVVEIREKPSVPKGIQGRDAFGRLPPQSEDRGIRKRAILDLGLADTETKGLTPLIKGIEIITSNSNYTIADVTDCEQNFRVGDIVEFSVNYSAMTRLFLSPYMQKNVLDY